MPAVRSSERTVGGRVVDEVTHPHSHRLHWRWGLGGGGLCGLV